MSRPDPLGLVGTTIAEKYAIEAVVGEGGFAIVYKARHELWKRPVAVKVFKALSDVAASDRARLLEEFVREGALLAELSERSAAIVQARDVGTVKVNGGHEIPYMVLEWLEGDTLESVLEKERKASVLPRTLDQMMRLLEPVAVALALAHSKGIAHRDIKPANVFVLGDPRGHDTSVKLLDFGIAKVVQDVQKVGGAFSKTSGELTSFTPLYGAPEQFNRSYGSTGPWTDVFAFALVAMELLTHHEGLDGDNVVQLAFSSANPERRPTPRTFGAIIPDAVEAVFAKALSVKTDARYASAGDFWNALREAVGMSAIAPRSSTIGVSAVGIASTQLAPPDNNRGSIPGALVNTGPGGLVGTTSFGNTTGPGSLGTTALQPQPGSPAVTMIIIGVVVALLLGGGYIAYSFFGDGGAPKTTTNPSKSATPSATAPTDSAAMKPIAASDAGACLAGMVKIPGGDFFMGSDEKDALANEKPAHPVHVDAYCLDATEVTSEAFMKCSKSGKCLRASRNNEWSGITAEERKLYDPLCTADVTLSAGDAGAPNPKAQHPINCVTWDQARTYCEAENGRLPTEAEWEFAARGSDGRIYPWGDDKPNGKLLNACGKECGDWEKASKLGVSMMYDEDDGFPATAPVKSFPAGVTMFGNYDMVGNVWEWVADAYAEYPKADGTTSRVSNPRGPEPTPKSERVIRGGAFNASNVSWVRPTFRYYDEPSKKSYGIGFRCAKTL